MMMTNADITIFNKRYNSTDRTDDYIPTVIRGVSLYSISGSSGEFKDRSESNTFKVRIPIDADFGGKSFVDEFTYKGMRDVTNYWTLQRDAIIVPMDVDDVGITPTELAKKYGTVITVTDFSDNTCRGIHSLKHWRAGGK